MFGKKKDNITAQQPIGFTKQKRFLFFKIRSKPIYQTQPQTQQTQQQAKISKFQMYIASVAAKHKGLDLALREAGIKESTYDFIKKMLINSIIVSAMLVVAIFVLLIHYYMSYATSAILSLALGIAIFEVFFNKFVNYPIDKSRNEGKEIEKSILFAARDLVIGMRSGMPLFNALTTVSTGYGAASREFAKIVELVQLGMPIEQAIDEVSSKSQSKTFKNLMLQASVSIKAGADIVGALQGVIDEVMQERTIELRRYGQRLNALAMFYMLFGVIFPSMGIAVAAILTTFISLFTIDESTLIFTLVGIFFLQLIFLNIMRSSRPTFAM